MKLWAGHHYTARSCCDLELHRSNPHVERDKSSHYGDHFCEIILSQLQITRLWAGQDFAARSFDLDLLGSDPNDARDTLSQYGYNFCEIVLKSHFK